MNVEITEETTYKDAVTTASKAILADYQVRQMFPKSDLWLVGFDVVDKDDGDPVRFSTIVHDTASGRSVWAEGTLEDPEDLVIIPTQHQQPPSEEEHAWAVQRLRDHMDWKDAVNRDGVTAYRPNPPLANVEHPDGSVERVVTIGLRSELEAPLHRVMGVKTGDGDIVAEPLGARAPSDAECGVTPLVAETGTAGADQVRIRVPGPDGGDTPLWGLVVVRPRASSGINGSGIELRNVDYKGQRVLARAHLPILTVEQDGVVQRLWLREEAAFEATGDDMVPGFRMCTEAPRTILDQDGAEAGDFRGVALRVDGDDLVLTTELQAGWHRVVCEWRLHADGTIRPRFGAAAVRNPATCEPHLHRAHWRLDFDIAGLVNVVQEFNETPIFGLSQWHTMRYEAARPRDGVARTWRVRSARSSQGYSLTPGAGDGVPAADPAAADVWIVRYHDAEVDDGVGVTAAAADAGAQLDRFVTGEPVHTADVVLWYAADLARPGPAAMVGPDLAPSNWKEAGGAEVFAPLEPPSA